MHPASSSFSAALTALIASGFVAAAACGTRGGSTASASGAGGGTTSASATTGGAGGVEDCSPKDACEVCGAMACVAQKKKCCDTPGCATIIACGREHQCNGTDCYTAANCQKVVDAHGGPLGEATAAAEPLGACAAMHCPTCPGVKTGTGTGSSSSTGTGG